MQKCPARIILGVDFRSCLTYGVGKSTLCNKLSTALKIPDFSAGDLISAVNGETYGENKVVRDKDANQNILASQVKQLLDLDIFLFRI